MNHGQSHFKCLTVFVCPHCGTAFNVNANIRRHIRNVHGGGNGGDGNGADDQSHPQALTPVGYMLPFHNFHSDKSAFVRHHCGNVFSVQSNMRRHIRNTHGGGSGRDDDFPDEYYSPVVL